MDKSEPKDAAVYLDYTNAAPPPRPLSRREYVVFALFALAPLIGAVIWTVWLTAYWWEAGVTFRRGLHVFGFMVHAWVMLALLGASVVVAFIAYMTCYPRTTRRQRYLLLPFTIAGAVFFFVSLSIATSAFNRGRDAAYQRLDLGRLTAEAATLPAIFGNDRGRGRIIHDYDAEAAQWPAYLTAVNPMAVGVNDHVVVVHMDGGGIGGREGVVIWLNPEQVPARLLQNVRPLDPGRGVYRFETMDQWYYLQAPGE